MTAAIHEFPVYKIVQTNNSSRWPCWNVLCSAYGDSGYLYSYAAVEKWVAGHITQYVKLSDHLAVVRELEQTEKQAKDLGYANLEDALADLAVLKEQRDYPGN
jgi:hypothetical protein